MKLTFKTKGIVVFNCNVDEREDFFDRTTSSSIVHQV